MHRSLFRYVILMSCILIILSSLLIGCSRTQVEEKRDKAGNTEALSREKSITNKKKIVFWHIQLSDSVSDVIKRRAEHFMADYPDVEVEIVPYLNEPYKIKLVVAMGTRNPPDIFSTWSGGPLYEYIKAGQVADLTPMMEKDNYKDYFLDAAIDMVTFDGKIWGVPVENSAIAVIFYNKKIFQENDISPPKTYNELLETVKKLRSKGIIPFALANRTKWPGSMYYMYLVDRIGGPDVFKKAAARSGGTFEDEAFIKAGQKIQELVKLGAFPDGFNGLDYDTGQSRSLMYSGKAAMELIGTWNIATIKDENKEFYENNLDFFPFPEVEGGKGEPNNAIGTLGDGFYSISRTCKYPEEAFRFIQYLIDEEAVKERTVRGRISPVKNFKTDDPVLQRVLKLISTAPSIQLWYDQYLPPELGEKHKDTCQALFDGSMTPEQAAKVMEDAAKNFYKTKN
ncbi:MAG: raffinose/stachyose/melibiose transport system substrate-binding protein [Petroclostridium sp.]|nr:extracellular solute-binding protein [Clostridia bacterium]MDK2809432.1 raffinose/stachyose/melibiose transport system substrate-binding protein [Petroclostridium sp.]